MRAKLPHSISPRKGLGPLEFGSSRAAIRRLLGEPTSTTALATDGWEWWDYRYHAITLSFCEEADWRCTRLWTDDASYLVAGRVVLGIPLEQLIRFLPRLGLGPHRAVIQRDRVVLLDFPDSDLEILVDEEISACIAWGAPIDANDAYVFPDTRASV